MNFNWNAITPAKANRLMREWNELDNELQNEGPLFKSSPMELGYRYERMLGTICDFTQAHMEWIYNLPAYVIQDEQGNTINVPAIDRSINV